MNYVSELTDCKLDNLTDKTDILDYINQKCKQLGDLIYLLVFKHHEVQIGLIRKGEITLDRQEELIPDLIKEIRAFSKAGELYIWNQGGELKSRLRIDGSGDKKLDIYRETHAMWGNKKTGNTIYEEKRGMELKIPFHVDESKLPLQYSVKNYYKFDGDGLIQFQDARFVEFLDSNGNALI